MDPDMTGYGGSERRGKPWISREVRKAPKPSFLAAWYKRVKPWFVRYLPGVASKVTTQAQGEAGGRTKLGQSSGTEQILMSSLTEETVQALSDDELKALHKRCHDLAKGAK